jgi:hypothetical protein
LLMIEGINEMFTDMTDTQLPQEFRATVQL